MFYLNSIKRPRKGHKISEIQRDLDYYISRNPPLLDQGTNFSKKFINLNNFTKFVYKHFKIIVMEGHYITKMNLKRFLYFIYMYIMIINLSSFTGLKEIGLQSIRTLLRPVLVKRNTVKNTTLVFVVAHHCVRNETREFTRWLDRTPHKHILLKWGVDSAREFTREVTNTCVHSTVKRAAYACKITRWFPANFERTTRETYIITSHTNQTSPNNKIHHGRE